MLLTGLLTDAAHKLQREKAQTDKLRGYFRHWYISGLTLAKILDSRMTGIEMKDPFEDWMWRKAYMTNITIWRHFILDKRQLVLRHIH